MARPKARDDFPATIKRQLAARTGHKCSNPACSAQTSGPRLELEKAVNLGVAAHISGAAAGGPRYNPELTAAARCSISNAIWLCQNCAKLIDNDELRHPEQLLLRWKLGAENDAQRRVGKTQTTRSAVSAERLLKRNLKARDELKKILLKSWEERQRERRSGERERPFDKFRCRYFIIHRLGDDNYPDPDDSPGISSWFKLEPFDFYHGGIKFVVEITSGVIEHRDGSVGHLHWATIPHGARVNPDKFRPISIWVLGLIPFRNIRQWDPHGDEYYSVPHLYCDFNANEMPYERFEHAVVAADGEYYDWPLKEELRLPKEAVLSREIDAHNSRL